MNFVIEKIDTIGNFEQLEPIWNDFLKKTSSDNPFLTFEFLINWWKSFKENKKLLILLVKDSGKLIGIAPLMIEQNNIKFIRNVHSYNLDFIIKEKAEDVLNTIFTYLKDNIKFNKIILEDIPENSTNLRILKKVLKNNKLMYTQKGERTCALININNDWKTYLSNLDRKSKHHFNNAENRIKKIKTNIVNYSKEDLDKGIKDVLEIEKKSWKNQIGNAITNKEKEIMFYTNLAKTISKKEMLSLTILYSNNLPIAHNYSIDYNKKRYNLKHSFSEEFKKFSPGRFLYAEVVKEAFDKNLIQYDLLGNVDSLKKDFANLYKKNIHLIIHKRNFKNIVYLFLKKYIWIYFAKFKSIQKIKNKILNRK